MIYHFEGGLGSRLWAPVEIGKLMGLLIIQNFTVDFSAESLSTVESAPKPARAESTSRVVTCRPTFTHSISPHSGATLLGRSHVRYSFPFTLPLLTEPFLDCLSYIPTFHALMCPVTIPRTKYHDQIRNTGNPHLRTIN